MRKAVQAAARRTRIRRNSTGNNHNNNSSNNNDDSPPSSPGGSTGSSSYNGSLRDVSTVPSHAPPIPGTFPSHHHHHPTITTLDNTRRKATVEEAALTAKNYRLAKELSELRVRHREETKNVNRLTMENMNLASRCRGAISHVAMLKKELANIQQQHLQQQQLQQRIMSSSSQLQNDTTTVASVSSSGKGSVGSNPNNGNGRRTPVQQQPLGRTGSTLQINTSNSPARPLPKSPQQRPLPLAPPSDTGAPPMPSTAAVSVLLKPRTERASSSEGIDPQMDHLLATARNHDSSPPSKAAQIPQQQQLDVVAPAANARSRSNGRGEGTNAVSVDAFDGDEDDNTNNAENEDDDDDANGEEEESVSELPRTSPNKSAQRSSSPAFPHSASPKLGRSLYNNSSNNNNSYNEQFPGDITSVNRLHSRNRAAPLGGFEEEESDLPPLTIEDDKSTISSIDAFEASFNTNFPDSFTSAAASSSLAAAGSATSPETRRTGSMGVSSPSNDPYNPFSSSPQNPSPMSSTSVTTSISSSSRHFYNNKRMNHRADPPGKNRTSPRTQQELYRQQYGHMTPSTAHGLSSTTGNSFKTSTGAFSPTLVSTTSTTPTQNLRTPRSTSIATFQHSGSSSIHNMNASSYSSPLKKNFSPHSSSNLSSTTPTSLVGMTRLQQQCHHQQQPLHSPATPPSSRPMVSSSSPSPPRSSYKTPPPMTDLEPPPPVDSGSGNRNKQPEQPDLAVSSTNSGRVRYEQALQPNRLQLSNDNDTDNATSNLTPSKGSNTGTFSAFPNNHHKVSSGDEDTSSLKDERNSVGGPGFAFTKHLPRRTTSGGNTDGSQSEDQRRTFAAPADSRSSDPSSLSLDGTPVRTRAEFLIQQQMQKSQRQLQSQPQQETLEEQYPLKRHQSSPVLAGRYSAGSGSNSGSKRDIDEKQQHSAGNNSPLSSNTLGGKFASTGKRDSPFEEKKSDHSQTSSPSNLTNSRLSNMPSSTSPRDFSAIRPQHRSQQSTDGRTATDLNTNDENLDGGATSSTSATAAESPPAVSVKDRVSLFSSAGSPRSPEGERVRINSVSSSPTRPHQHPPQLQQQQQPHSSPPYAQHSVRSENPGSSPRPFMVDDGDIPLVSSIRRTSKDSYSHIHNNRSNPSFKKFSPWTGDEDGSLSSTVTGTSTVGGGGTV
ncbi:hypothetical protein ACA910_008038 [Epithemia clementina (nom. ined.)]